MARVKDLYISHEIHFTAHFDFVDFFPSFSERNVISFLQFSLQLSDVDAEFCSKIDGLLQEADESELWLELLMDDCEVKSELARLLHKETDELISIFTTIVSKVRKNLG